MELAGVIAFEAWEARDLDAWIEGQKARQGSGRSIRCARCDQRITSAEQRMEQAGAHQHRFENPDRIAFHIGCFRHAPGCRCVGEPTLAWTWFAGQPWSVALCCRCGTHLGWHYGAGGLADAFYGLILDRLSEGI